MYFLAIFNIFNIFFTLWPKNLTNRSIRTIAIVFLYTITQLSWLWLFRYEWCYLVNFTPFLKWLIFHANSVSKMFFFCNLLENLQLPKKYHWWKICSAWNSTHFDVCLTSVRPIIKVQIFKCHVSFRIIINYSSKMNSLG